MKKLLLIVSCLIASPALALNVITSCPSGYVQIQDNNALIVDGSCPSGYTAAGTVSSCLLASPSGVCYLYIPANESSSDSKGTYKYTQLCELS